MPADEAGAITAARSGRDFAELCAGLCAWHGETEVPMRGAGLLKQWISDGLISQVIGY
jgi:hypothetical protein